MAKLLAVLGKIRQRIIDLADQKVLAIIQASDCLGSWVSYSQTYWLLLRFVNHLVLRKSYYSRSLVNTFANYADETVGFMP